MSKKDCGCVPCGNTRGERGLQGVAGPQGDPGPAGPAGANGNDGADAVIADTGWVDLQGFDHYTGSMAASKPQCRLIGTTLHFRGDVIIPLSNDGGATLIPLSSITAYQTEYFNSIYTGSGGVTNNSNGSVQFNNNGQVIPSSVIPTSLDGSYRLTLVPGIRQIKIDDNDGTLLSTLGTVIITSDRKMQIALVKDLEELSTIIGTPGNRGIGSSHLNYVISNVTSGSYLRDFRSDSVDGNTPHEIATDTTEPIQTDAYQGHPSGPGLQYPFSCDANQQNQIGGFGFRLDGLMGYIAPL